MKIAEPRRDIPEPLPRTAHDYGRQRHRRSPTRTVTAGPDGLPRISGMTEIAVGSSTMVYLYGQVAHDSQFDVREQLLGALNLVDRLLREAGGRPTHILSVRLNLLPRGRLRCSHVGMGSVVSLRTGRNTTAGVREGTRQWLVGRGRHRRSVLPGKTRAHRRLNQPEGQGRRLKRLSGPRRGTLDVGVSDVRYRTDATRRRPDADVQHLEDAQKASVLPR